MADTPAQQARDDYGSIRSSDTAPRPTQTAVAGAERQDCLEEADRYVTIGH